MNIIIVGCGKVGVTLAEQLHNEGHSITLIDKDAARLRKVTDHVDVMGMEGNGLSYEVQIEAGITEANLLIATTHSDEQNMLCCLIAKKAGNCHTIARVRNPEYVKEVRYIREELNMSMVINPELAAASEIARLVKFPSAIKIDSFAKGRIEMMKFVIPEKSDLSGLPLSQVNVKLHCNVLICAVERGDDVVIPDGNFVLMAGDKVSFIGKHKQALDFFKKANVTVNQTKSVMLIGGGKIAYYLAKALEDTGISIKIIEHSFEKCQELSELLSKAMIIHGDGTDQDLLLEEGIENTDVVASLTGFDEENIMLSLYASSLSNTKLVTKINRIGFESVIKKMNLGSIINPKLITADSIVSYVRAMQNSMGSNVETVYKIVAGKAEALEFRVGMEPKIVGIPLQKLTLKAGLLVACINRNGKIITPNGQDTIERGDTVVIVTTQTGLNDLKDILA